jgi:hypothetical protein
MRGGYRTVLPTAYLDRLYFAGLHGFEAHETEDGGRLNSDNSSGMFIVKKVQGSIRFSPLQQYLHDRAPDPDP